MIRNPKLCKALEYLVDKWGPVNGRTRFQKLIYLADLKWSKMRGDGRPYTESHYYRWNHGPFSREFLQAIEWMNGIEIVQTGQGDLDGYTYRSGVSTRLRDVEIDADFQTLLDEIGQEWRHKTLRSLLEYVYGDDDFKAKEFGDDLF